ncbi:MAG: Rieske (2Fe-2S) protein [Anaerovoracaceae bacterium]|jgi:3-phenylpropionate/trans-cinnamate dioxygenase ferredoxin subunit
MNYVKIASIEEVRPGEMKGYTVEGRSILLANVNDSYYAMENVCPHMGGILSEGTLEGKEVTCPKHGSVFDVSTGKALQDGKILFLKAKVHDLMSYTVKVEGDDVFVDIG